MTRFAVGDRVHFKRLPDEYTWEVIAVKRNVLTLRYTDPEAVSCIVCATVQLVYKEGVEEEDATD